MTSNRTLQGGKSEDFNALLTNQNFPLMVAWKDQMEEYLIVTETGNGFLPDGNKNFIVPAPYCVGSEFQRKEPPLGPEADNFAKGSGFASPRDPSQPADGQTGPSLNPAPSNPFHLHANGGYVDIPEHAPAQAGDGAGTSFIGGKSPKPETNDSTEARGQAKGLSEDYSRVKDVNGESVVFLEPAPVHASCEEKDYTDSARVETKTPPEAAAKEGTSTEFTDSGYIDTVPHTAVI